MGSPILQYFQYQPGRGREQGAGSGAGRSQGQWSGRRWRPGLATESGRKCLSVLLLAGARGRHKAGSIWSLENTRREAEGVGLPCPPTDRTGSSGRRRCTRPPVPQIAPGCSGQWRAAAEGQRAGRRARCRVKKHPQPLHSTHRAERVRLLPAEQAGPPGWLQPPLSLLLSRSLPQSKAHLRKRHRVLCRVVVGQVAQQEAQREAQLAVHVSHLRYGTAGSRSACTPCKRSVVRAAGRCRSHSCQCQCCRCLARRVCHTHRSFRCSCPRWISSNCACKCTACIFCARPPAPGCAGRS